MAFQPEKHLIELQGKSYLEVRWRIVWFRQENPQGIIRTEEVCVDLDRVIEAEVPTGNWIPNPNRPGKKMPEKRVEKKPGYARFKAIVEDGKGGHAEATKTECASAFPDYCEKAETGAIGRALALLGYGTAFTADELNEQHRIVDAPVERAQGRSVATNGAAASQPQSEQPGATEPEHSDSFNTLVSRVRTRAYKLGIRGEQWSAYIVHVTGKASEQALDIADVGTLNGDLQAKEQQLVGKG